MEVASPIKQQPADESAAEGLKPANAKMSVARKLLAGKARSTIYELLAGGLLDESRTARAR